MSYTPEQLARLKELIHEHLQKNKVFDTVKEMLEKEAISEALAQERILQTLSNQGVLGDVLTHIREIPAQEQAGLEYPKRYLLFKVLYGKAFLDFIGAEHANSHLQVHISFLQQRFSSKKVPCTVEPIFDESFLLQLTPPDTSLVDFATLVKLRAPIHIVLTKEKDGIREVVSTKFIEWRLMLSTGSLQFPIELLGTGTRAKLSVGVLQVQFDLMPKVDRGSLLTDRIVNEQMNLEKKYERDITHGFFEYSNEWWKDFKQIRPSHEKRMVKIFAETEDGVYKPVCSLVQPLKTNRLLDSPLHAARFVSLIPFVRDEAPGGVRNETWYHSHTFLCRGAGDCEDHAVLLAGLLLGWGLDAYVCIGTSGEGPHAWVLTKGTRDMFWESLTGQRLFIDDPRVHRFYRKVGCVFNHKHFYGNIQVDDVVANTNWDLEDESCWKSMAADMVANLVPASKYLPLLPPIPNPYEAELQVENSLKNLIIQHRARTDLLTNFDEDLGYLLSPALINYEIDRVGGVTFGNEEFQQSIKRYVPEGHTFKAYPAQFQHTDAEKMMISLCQASVAQDILYTRGDTVRFGLRCKLVSYPEERVAVWIMLAVRYRAIL